MGLLGILKNSKKKKEKKAVDKIAKVDSGGQKRKKPSMKELYAGGKDMEAIEVKKTEDGKKLEKKTKKYGNAYRILVKPLVTEKATNLGGQNKYVFAVALKTNKIEIAKAINEVYGIKPTAVNIVKMHGKKTRHGRIAGRTKDWKKAVVTLPAGKSIKVYEGV